MTDTVIQVENLGKRYVLGARQESRQYQALRDSLAAMMRASWRRAKPNAAAPEEEFWALREVAFEVRRGEVVGIIGRNGAGKSTLLKILSRITEPTEGTIRLRGRVSSLLEVGTGFHPELTGRENIFLNGAVLGMRRHETKAKFDQIVAFAEIERFLDTPVKRYSSGMYVRLAFAVAAHLEPEILVVDEVLAVGDAEFQKKCLGKMGEVATSGRTVLFVSHQISAIMGLCSRCILLTKGRIELDGAPRKAVATMMQSINAASNTAALQTMHRSGNGTIRLTTFRLTDAAGNGTETVVSGDTIRLVLGYQQAAFARGRNANVGISIHDQYGTLLTVFYSEHVGITFKDLAQEGSFVCVIPAFPFAPGRYFVGARIVANGVEADWPKDFIGRIDVQDGDYYGSGVLAQQGLGTFLLDGTWETQAAA